MWRVGGVNSSFSLDGFDFSRQHDARFSQSPSPDKEVITFLNNAGDGTKNTSTTSAAYKVELDHQSKTAKLLQQWSRPDGKLGTYRGNAQFLPNGNVLVHWGDNGYITEFDSDGTVLQEAHLLPPQLGTYRAYKFEWSATPREPIVVKCAAHRSTDGVDDTVCHVSWNGATDVAFWELRDPRVNEAEPLVRTLKKGFETLLVAPGLHAQVYVRALDGDWKALAGSDVVVISVEDALLANDYSDAGRTEVDPVPAYSGPVSRPWHAGARMAGWNGFWYLLCGLLLGSMLTHCFSRAHVRGRAWTRTGPANRHVFGLLLA